MQGNISNRIKSEERGLKKASDRAEKIQKEIDEKGTSKKLEKSLASAKQAASDIKENITELNAASKELSEMGSSSVEQKFTFKEITGIEGETYKENGIIVMEIISEDNSIHEATHAWQIHKGLMESNGKGKAVYPTGIEGLYAAELSAYRRQYAYGGNLSTVPSYYGSVGNIRDVSRPWLTGVNDGKGNYIYGQMLYPKLTPQQLESILNEVKKTGN